MASGGNHREPLPRESVSHLLVEHDGICWWCRHRPASTGEHKFKASDLDRLRGDDHLIWGDSAGSTREIHGRGGIRRDRHKVIKFPKSLCDSCNNAASQPFDRAYQQFSDYVVSHPDVAHQTKKIDYRAVYSRSWRRERFNLARYYIKHFGCRMVSDGIPPSNSMRAFLDNCEDMPDVRLVFGVDLALASTPMSAGLSLSRGFVTPTDREMTGIQKIVYANYIGAFGVRFEWAPNPAPNTDRGDFFSRKPRIYHFKNEREMFYGQYAW